jgi:hypothetical protein
MQRRSTSGGRGPTSQRSARHCTVLAAAGSPWCPQAVGQRPGSLAARIAMTKATRSGARHQPDPPRSAAIGKPGTSASIRTPVRTLETRSGGMTWQRPGTMCTLDASAISVPTLGPARCPAPLVSCRQPCPQATRAAGVEQGRPFQVETRCLKMKHEARCQRAVVDPRERLSGAGVISRGG